MHSPMNCTILMIQAQRPTAAKIFYYHILSWNLDPSSNIPWWLSDNSEEYVPYYSWSKLVRSHQSERRFSVSILYHFRQSKANSYSHHNILHQSLGLQTSCSTKQKYYFPPKSEVFTLTNTLCNLQSTWGIWQSWGKYQAMFSLWLF